MILLEISNSFSNDDVIRAAPTTLFAPQPMIPSSVLKYQFLLFTSIPILGGLNLPLLGALRLYTAVRRSSWRNSVGRIYHRHRTTFLFINHLLGACLSSFGYTYRLSVGWFAKYLRQLVCGLAASSARIWGCTDRTVMYILSLRRRLSLHRDLARKTRLVCLSHHDHTYIPILERPRI